MRITACKTTTSEKKGYRLALNDGNCLRITDNCDGTFDVKEPGMIHKGITFFDVIKLIIEYDV